MVFANWPSWCLLLLLPGASKLVKAGDDDYNLLHKDGSFQFGYNTPDSYHYADANRNNVVKGEFGSRSPVTGGIDSTVYTAGPRGYRPRGKNIVRKYDLNQNGPRPIGSRDDPYYDPYEDPSYSFAFRTRTHNRQENANRAGDVTGRYSYVDDVGERHNVEYIAGKKTGFHVKTPFPDSNPRGYGPLYFNGRGKPIPRGRTSIQRGLDGSYRFVSAGPDQRRTETSDSTGHVRGSYTYLDDKGVQHSVHYIAGPETGFQVLKNVKGPHLASVFPFGRPDIIPPDFYDYDNKDYKDTDLFDTAASGHVKPIGNHIGGSSGGGNKNKDKDVPSFDNGDDSDGSDGGYGGNKRPSGSRPNRPSGGSNRPNYDDDDAGSDDFGDLFGGGGNSDDGSYKPSGGSSKPSSGGSYKPSRPSGGSSTTSDDGSYNKPSGGSSRPSDDGSYNPSSDEDSSYKPPSSTTFRPVDFSTTTSRPFGPKPSTFRPAGRPSPRPTNFFSPDLDDDNFGLFGSETNSRPPVGGTSSRPSGGRPVVQIGVGGDGKTCPKCHGTIVTNVGDQLFTVPPGVSVRAHVQSIDLLPITSNVPSPSEQLKRDMSNASTEQLNSAASSQVVSASSTEKNIASTVTTDGPISTPVSTTLKITTTTEDEDDFSVFK